MSGIYPCLWFNGNAPEAVGFYQTVFDDVVIHQYTPLVITFYIKGFQFMALNGMAEFKPNPSVSFFTICKTEQEIEDIWNKLKEGGEILMPLNSYPWSDRYGFIKDKYGVTWQLSLPKSGEEDTIYPSLMFTGEQNGNAEKALNFYSSLFKNSEIKVLAKYEESDPDITGNIKYGQVNLNGFKMAVMDSSYPHQFTFDEGVSLVVNCDTQEEIDFYWLNLTDGGKESMCGWCQDSFGVWWQIVPSILSVLMSDAEKASKVSQAFCKMKKMDIAVIEAAANS